MSEWIKHEGSDMPVEEETTVEAKSKKGWTVIAPAWSLIWANVVEYRLSKANGDKDE